MHSEIRLPYLANKDTRHSTKFEFQVNYKSCSNIYPMQYWENTYTKNYSSCIWSSDLTGVLYFLWQPYSERELGEHPPFSCDSVWYQIGSSISGQATNQLFCKCTLGWLKPVTQFLWEAMESKSPLCRAWCWALGIQRGVKQSWI